MRIVIIYNQPKDMFCDLAESSVFSQVQAIAASLSEAGHDLMIFATSEVSELCVFLIRHRPELIFNCCESFNGCAQLEMNVAALFELFGIPYTGSPALVLGLALNKTLAKSVLWAQGISTPAYAVIEPGHDPAAANHLNFPLIVKPAAEDASIGIDDGAVVNDELALAERVRFIWNDFHQPALVEEFITGREFNVALLSTSPADFVALPVGEIIFDGLEPDRPRIVSYEAKWMPDSPSYRGTIAQYPAVLDSGITERIRHVALDAARAVGVKDYARVDIRLREQDQEIFVLEVNPNPDLNEEAGFSRAARASGRSYSSTICEIVERAIERSIAAHTESSTRIQV